MSNLNSPLAFICCRCAYNVDRSNNEHPTCYCEYRIQHNACSGKYRGADKSLARPARKQARKHVRDARDFNNVETRAVIEFIFSCIQGAQGDFTPF